LAATATNQKPRFGGVFIGSCFCQDKLQIKDMMRSGPDPNQGRFSLGGVTSCPRFFVSTDGCFCFMPMDLSGLLRRLLTDSHIDFASLKGGA